MSAVSLHIYHSPRKHIRSIESTSGTDIRVKENAKSIEVIYETIGVSMLPTS